MNGNGKTTNGKKRNSTEWAKMIPRQNVRMRSVALPGGKGIEMVNPIHKMCALCGIIKYRAPLYTTVDGPVRRE